MDINELFEDLKSSDIETRRYAVEDLVEENDDRIPAKIAELLEDDDDSVRERVIDSLVEINDKFAVQAVVPFLFSENVPARNGAIEILESIGSVAPEELFKLLNGSNDDVTIFTLTIVSKLGDINIDVTNKVIDLLNSDKENIVAEACLAIGGCGSEEQLPKLEEVFINTKSDSLKIHTTLAMVAIGGAIAKQCIADLEKIEGLNDNVKMHLDMANKMIGDIKEIQYFCWDDKYSVKNELIDEQHKTLFQLGNDIFDVNYNDCKQYILELFKYIRVHFSYEEDFLRKNNFEYLDEHIESHCKLIEDFNLIIEKGINNEHELGALQTFIWSWLTQHIMREDRKYIDCENKGKECKNG